jgi:hypothetical protein
MLVFLVRGIYELCPSDGIGCRDVCTMFHIDWSSHSIVSEDTHTEHTQQSDVLSLLLFFQNKEIKVRKFFMFVRINLIFLYIVTVRTSCHGSVKNRLNRNSVSD